MLDKLDAALRFQQEALNLRAQRQEVLAANIANADTPGYQARDIDFASELKKVMQRGRDATNLRQFLPAPTLLVRLSLMLMGRQAILRSRRNY